MANFSVNQNRQVYIANHGYDSVTSPAVAGTVTKFAKDAEANNFYFLFQGADTVLKSDYISIDTVKARVTNATHNRTYMKKVYVTVTADAIVGGQDYVLGINFRNFFSSGDSSQYYKDAVVHGVQGMSKSDFYKAMVTALNAAFAREDGATKTSNPYLAFSVDNANATKIIIEEKPQEWALGTKKARRIMFDVLPSTIYTGGDDVIWGTVTQETTAGNLTFVGNGQKVADLEWFGMGERGDQYRNVGWPNVIPTTYLADPTKEYHLLELHYAFTDSGVNSYRSEKELTIAVPMGSAGHETEDIAALVTAMEAMGITVDDSDLS